MEIVVSLLLGIIIGSAFTYYVLQKTQQRKTVREYETQIQVLKEQHQQALKDARNRSLDGSRAVIKGKIAEQLAPVLPNFKYLPSDARFIGDPIDYVIFNGYTDIKDNGGNENNLEVVILDVKTGQANLSQFQQAIARAINAGRVRFEVV
jgi:predicted Holliday junction resolvase-like endonuclease